MLKGRTELFVHNSAMMAFQQVIGMVTAFIIPRVILTVYGSEINGFVVSVTQFISYFVLVEAGISGASIYALYKPLAEHNIPAINGILSAAKKFYLTSGYIFLTLVCLLSVLYPIFAKTLHLTAWQISLVVFALGAKGVFDFFTLSKYRVLLTASQKSYIISSAQVVYLGLNTLIVWGLAKLGFSIVTVEVTVVFSVFVRSWLLYYYTKKHFPYVDYTVEPDKESIKDRWSVLYLQLLRGAQSAIPVMLATMLTSLLEVSVYSIYNLVLSGIGGILSIFISGLAASFGDVIARKQHRILKESTQQFEQSYYILLTIVYGVSLLMILPFVKLYTANVNDVNYLLPWLGFLFVVRGLFDHLKTPQGMLVISAGMYRQTRWQTTTQAVIAVIGGALGGWLWGLYGILGGLILSHLYRCIDLLFFIPKHVTRLSYIRSLRHMVLVVINFGLVVLVWWYRPFQIRTIWQWGLYATASTVGISCWVVVTNYALDPKNMTQIYHRICKLILRRIKCLH